MSAIVEKTAAENSDSDEEEEKVEEVAKEVEPEEDTSLANSDVVTKYQEAAKIANATMAELITLCVAGARIVDICHAGEQLIEQKCSTIFTKKVKGKLIEKGCAFPVCVSVNELICNVSPLNSEPETTFPALCPNDTVKLHLGVHISGYLAAVAHTLVVAGASAEATEASAASDAKRADVINAAWTAAELATRMIKPGNTNKQVTAAIESVASAYGVNLMSGTKMFQTKRYVYQSSKVILGRAIEGEAKTEECTFEPFEVYGVDITMTSGEGKPRETGNRVTVYRRNVEKKYGLKVKASRVFMNEVNKRFPTLPFSLRSFEDEKTAKMGSWECAKNDLLECYPVYTEKEGAIVAHVKFTVLLLASGNTKITGFEMPPGFVSEGKELPEDLVAILATEEGSTKKKKKKAAKKAPATSAAEQKDA